MTTSIAQPHAFSTTGVLKISRALTSVVLFVLAGLVTEPAQAQTYTVLYSFTSHGDGTNPTGVIRDAKGNLYGSTTWGGAFGFGTVFIVDKTRKETILHSFTGGDGFLPNSELIRDANGNLYGTTYDGGTPEGGKCRYGCGTVFKVDKAGKETMLYAFAGGTNPGNPTRIVRDHAGDFFGIAGGGSPGDGVVFELSKTGKFTVLYSFTGQADGGGPDSLVLAEKGALYGTAVGGGDLSCKQGQGCGVVFKLTRKGKGQWKETVLYSFTGGTDGSNPSSLVLDRAGNFYGIAQGGDFNCDPQYGCGLIFKMDKTGGLSVLYVFTGYPTDGNDPYDLVSDRHGNLYGTTVYGGSADNCGRGSGCGTVFALNKTGKETIVHSFDHGDGSFPDAVLPDRTGNIYGTTYYGGDLSCGGGSGGCGVVFKITP